MAIKLVGAGRVTVRNWSTPYTGDKVTMSIYIKVDSKASGYITRIFTRGSLFFGIEGNPTATGFTFSVRGATVDNASVAAYKAGASYGQVYHLMFVYDADDPSRRFFAVNGSKVAWGVAATGAMSGLSTISYGSDAGNDFTVQSAMFLDGYAATDDDLFLLADDSSKTADVFAAGLAAGAGTGSFLHSLDGTIGTTPAKDDPGLIYGSNANYWAGTPAVVAGGTGSITYLDPISSYSQLRLDKAYIGSTGGTMTLIATSYDGSVRITPAATELQGAVSIRVDGGEPIALPTTAATGAYVDPTADAVFLALPTLIPPTSTVTLDAPDAWFKPAFGYLPAVTGFPVGNYAGRPISEGLWPDAPPPRIGTNTTLYNGSYFAANLINKNRAASLAGNGNPATWPDGTIKGNYDSGLILSGQTSDENKDGTIVPSNAVGKDSLFKIGMKGRDGLYALVWDDYDPAKPVDMVLRSMTNGMAVEEVAAYYNPGDELGRGKVRVYRVRASDPRATTLASNVDATATEIPYAASLGTTVDDGWITLDDEQIKVGGTASTPLRFTNCTRGWNGTTATAHAAGTAITARQFTRYGFIYLKITSADSTTTRYANLSVYDPENWTPPSPPAMVSLPHIGPLENDAAFEEFIGHGVGGIRWMNDPPIQGGNDVDCYEQMSKLDDPRYGVKRYAEKFVVASVRPYDPVASPYTFPHIPVPNTETYTVTLTDAIETTPEAGTTETIRIQAGDPSIAPVLFHQVLWIGSEKMRVVGEPLTGDLYEVERGVEGTAVSTHAAGSTITVGYRIPIVAESQYKPPETYPLHRYEILFDRSQSTPPTWGRALSKAMGLGWPADGNGIITIPADVNIASRRTLTLTAPVGAADLTLAVAPADPGDWSYIAPRLKVFLGAETLTVAAVDSTAGTITVATRPATAAAYTAGTTATTGSRGVLLVSDDGTARAYAELFMGKAAMYPTGPGRVLAFGSDDDATPALGGASATTFGEQTFDSTATTATCRMPDNDFPYELMASTTAKAPGSWCWVNAPLRASDDFIYKMAKAVRDYFPNDPERKVVFELSNEVWNWAPGFQQTAVALIAGAVCNVAGERNKDFYIARSQSAFNVFKRCFAETGRGGQCIQVVAWQQGSELLSTARRLGTNPDAYAVAPYLHTESSDGVRAMWDLLDNSRYCDFFTFITYYDLNRYRKSAEFAKQSRNAHEAATGKRVKILYYEGGLEQFAHGITGTYAYIRQRDLAFDPANYYTERDFYAAVGAIGEVDLYCQFDTAGGGVKQLWGLFRGPAQKPGYGDGRNGSVDNRLCTFVDPTDLTKCPDSENDSVRAQAMIDHADAFRAYMDGLEPEPGDHPGAVAPPPATIFERPRKFLISRRSRGYR